MIDIIFVSLSLNPGVPLHDYFNVLYVREEIRWCGGVEATAAQDMVADSIRIPPEQHNNEQWN